MAVASFQLSVPRKTAAGQLPITKVKAIVAVETTAAVTFRVSDPRAAPVVQTVGPLSPGSANALVAFTPAPAGAPDFDALGVVSPSAALPANDPLRRRYEFWFDLNSDFDPNNFCANTMAAASETWTISVIAGPQITSVCLQSFDQNTAAACEGIERRVPVTEPTAAVLGFPAATQPCRESRPGVDSVLVLDHSGSMGSSTLGGAPQTKIQALRTAVTDFVTVWNNLRASEGGATPSDKIGVTLFDDNANWWAAIPNGLNDFAGQQAAILGNVNTIAPAGSTSIGDGLLLADGALSSADATRRRVILLMSDGQQNDDRLVGVMGGQVVTYPPGNPAANVALPNQAKYQIYSVTVGTGTAVDAQINQDVAAATRGFYINSEDNAGQMTPFFLELLQNFLRFNSWETYRMVSAEVSRFQPYATTLRITSTTEHVVVHLRWPARNAALRLRSTPAGDATPTEQVSTQSITMRFTLPTSPTYEHQGEWQLEVQVADAAADAVIPFELVVLGEDAAFDSELEIAPRDYVPGDEIELTARLSEFGRPLTGLGGQAGATLVARIVKPGVSIGDLLAGSKSPSTAPADQDRYSPASAKLFNELQKNPGALARDSSDTVTLTEVGDGIYRGRYRVQTPGHYNFLLGVAGQGRAGNFERMQLKSVWVRPAPDTDATEITASIQSRDGNRLVVSMRPRTRFNNQLGPGWANYFWFTTPGGAPVKAQDNLDGSYSASIPFTGPVPLVSLHFLPVSMIIDDSVTADRLPVPLDDSNALVPVVGAPPIVRRWPKWLLWLLLLLLILLGYLRWRGQQP